MIAILWVLLLVSALIFVHELGHFLVAKLAGVEVQKFYLGFDIPVRIGRWEFSGSLVRFRWRETEYGIGWLFFGGYVRMLGQSDTDPGAPRTVSPRDFRNRPWGWRIAILLGGVAMNALFAFIFTVIAFSVGINFQVPALGGVEPGSAAWLLGLEGGDTVVLVNGSAPDDLSDIVLDVVTAQPGKRVPMVIERAGQRYELDFLPTLDTGAGVRTVGLIGRTSNVISVDPGSTAERAGLRDGDRLLSWRPGGLHDQGAPEMLPFDANDGEMVFSAMRMNAGSKICFEIERDGATLLLEVEIGESASRLVLGLGQDRGATGLTVTAVRGRIDPAGTPGAPAIVRPVADGRLVPGDRLRLVGGSPVASGGEALERLTVAGKRDTIEVTLQPWWDRFTDDEYSTLLRLFAGADAPELAGDDARASYYASRLEELPPGDGTIGLLAAAFPGRPILATQVRALELLRERARLGGAARTDPGFLAMAADVATQRGARLLPPADPRAPFALEVTFPPEARSELAPRSPTGSVHPTILFGGEPLLSPPARALRAHGAPILGYSVAGSAAAAAQFPTPFVLEAIVTHAEGRQEATSWSALPAAVQASGGEPITLVGYPVAVASDPEVTAPLEITLTPRPAGSLGIGFEFETYRQTASLGEVVPKGVNRTIRQFRTMLHHLRALVSGWVSLSNVGGPILIVEVSYRVSRDYGLGRLLYLIAFISINLAILNVLPIPPFDGGHIVLVLYEVVTGRAPGDEMLNWFLRLGLVVFLTLVVFVFWNDVSRLIGR